MKCPRCGFDNPDYLEYCRNCSAELPANKGENAKPAWGFVKAPKWSEPDFSADSVSEDDIPEDFVSETETFRKQREAERRAAAEAAAEKARQAAEAAAAKLAYEEDPLTVERKSGDDRRTFERRYADEQRAAERKAEEERLLAERRSAEESERTENVRRSSKPQYSYDDEEDDYEDDYDDAPARKSIQLPAFLTNLFKRREKNNEDYDEEENGEDYDDFAYEKRYAKRSAKKGGSKFNLNTAIKIAAAVAALALLGLCIWLIASGIKSCSSASKSPTGSNKAPIIERDPDDPSIYYVTVFAKNGKVLIYETSNGTRQEATVDTGDSIKFKVFEGSLMPTEPIDDVSYPAQPKVYVKNDDGTETLIDNMGTIILNVPTIDVTYNCPDTITSDDGSISITGHIDLIATKLTFNGEEVAINPDGSFEYAYSFEDTGDYTIPVEGRLGGHQIYRHTFNVTVNEAHPTTALIELPWEYGDTSYAQRIVNSKDTIEVRGKVPAGSTLEATCDSSNAALTAPAVGEDGSFTFSAKLAFAGDYVIHLKCTTESGQISERDVHVQRAPNWSTYTSGAYQMNYASFAYEATQAYRIKGTVTEILQEGDYILAVLETADGNKLVIEYHNHYGSAGKIEVGKSYESIYGRPMGMGLNDLDLPQIYVWFVDD